MHIQQRGAALVVDTPAKLNLNLRVLGKRPDGFHDLETLFVSVGLFDTLHLYPSNDERVKLVCRPFTVSVKQVVLPIDSRNLIVRAAELLKETTGTTAGASILLEKRIPTEAGLGGGSSDAAAALVALNRFWGLGLSEGELHPLASRLGSDVNFFLDSLPAAVGRGRGERLERISLPLPMHFVVLKPPFGLSTRDVFCKLASGASITHSATRQTFPSDVVSWQDLKALIHNDLEAPARILKPEISRVLDRLWREDIVAAGMTGSGSACFALCRSRRQARVVAGRLRALRIGEVYSVSSIAS